MTHPEPAPTTSSTLRILAPWVVFFVLLAAALASFFIYADHVPSLLQALADR
mgnify:CR=1 FL=1